MGRKLVTSFVTPLYFSLSSDMATLRRQHREMRLGVKDIDNYVSTVERSKVNIQSLMESCSQEVTKHIRHTDKLRSSQYRDIRNLAITIVISRK